MKKIADTNILVFLASAEHLKEECDNGTLIIPAGVIEEARKNWGDNKYINEVIKKFSRCIINEARFDGKLKITRVPSREETERIKEYGGRPFDEYPIAESLKVRRVCYYNTRSNKTLGLTDAMLIAMAKDNGYIILTEDNDLRTCADYYKIETENLLEYTHETIGKKKK